MRVYNSNLAPNPRRVRIFLAERGLSAPMADVDLGRLEQKSAVFSARNPFQAVPALELVDGTIIAESMAICRYIEELHPDPPLFGVGALPRAMVEMWRRRLELGLFFRIAQAFRHAHPAMKAMESPQIKGWAEANKPRALSAPSFRFGSGVLAFLGSPASSAGAGRNPVHGQSVGVRSGRCHRLGGSTGACARAVRRDRAQSSHRPGDRRIDLSRSDAGDAGQRRRPDRADAAGGRLRRRRRARSRRKVGARGDARFSRQGGRDRPEHAGLRLPLGTRRAI